MAKKQGKGLVGNRNQKSDQRAPYMPTPEELEQAKAEIQSTWKESEKLRRQGANANPEATPVQELVSPIWIR